MSKQRLLDVERKTKRRGSKALVLITDCPKCGKPLDSVTAGMAALFRHAGHGATRTATQRYCAPCGFAGGSVIVETNPRADP